jgi:hypothetical protein
MNGLMLRSAAMLRTLLGYAVLAIVGFIALKLLFGLLGLAFSLFMTLLWLAAIGFVFYLALKLISPETARRVREIIAGGSSGRA